MDDSVLVRFAKTLLPKWGGQFDENMGLFAPDCFPWENRNETLAIARETRATENTLFFLPAVEVKGTFAIGGAGGAAVEV